MAFFLRFMIGGGGQKTPLTGVLLIYLNASLPYNLKQHTTCISV